MYAARGEALVGPEEAAVGDLHQRGVFVIEFQFEAHSQFVAAALLPIAAEAREVATGERHLVPKPGGNAGAAFELCFCLQ